MGILLLVLWSCGGEPAAVRADTDPAYDFAASRAGWSAANPVQGFGVELAAGVRIQDGARDVSMTLVRWGDPAAPRVAEPPRWEAGACATGDAGDCPTRLAGDRGGVVEWYENAPEGVEQGFTIAADPGGDSLILDLRVDGAAVRVDGDGAELVPASGAPLRYTGLRAWDADGRELDAHLAALPDGVRIEVDVRGAAWPVDVDPLIADHWYPGGGSYDVSLGSAFAIGDITGDGHAELLVGNTTTSEVVGYLGSPWGPAVVPTWVFTLGPGTDLGASLAYLGDVNADGFGDFAAGAPEATGQVHVYYGAPGGPDPTSPDWSTPGLEVGEGFGTAIDAAGDVNGDGYADLLVGSAYYDGGRNSQGLARVFFGSATGLEVAAGWSKSSGQSDSLFSRSVAGIGDVNGDGYDDIAMGAHGYDGAVANAGRVFVYHGSPTGPTAVASWTFDGTQLYANFGWDVAGGDVNGDGYGDLFASAPQWDNGQTDEGKVNLFHGSATGLGAAPVWTEESNSASSKLGLTLVGRMDVNGDGYDDLATSLSTLVYVYTSPGGVMSGNHLLFYGGSLLGATGDVDNDGYDDLVSGNSSFGATSFTLAHGSPGGPELESHVADWAVSGWTDGSGSSIADGGDFNADGYGDLLIGSNSNPGWFAGTGSDYLWYVSFSMADTAMSPIGDVDSDGYDDVVGAGTTSSVFYGSSNGLVDKLTLNVAATSAAAGDFDADGYADFVLGTSATSGFDTWYSDALGITAPGFVRTAGAAGDKLGTALAVGDFDGDGYDDLAATASADMVTFAAEGSVAVYEGAAAGLAPAPALVIAGGQADAECSGVAAGDVDGDGYDDLLYACPQWSDALLDVGRVQLFRGGPGGLSTPAAWTWTGIVAGDLVGADVTIADFTGDGFADLAVHAAGLDHGTNDTGAVHLFRGGFAGPEAQPYASILSPVAGGGSLGSITNVTPPDGDGTRDLAWGITGSFSDRAFVYDLDDDDGDGEPRFLDCDDADPLVSSAGVEIDNGRDEDCNGIIDDNLPVAWFEDADADGYGDPATRVEAVAAPAPGMVAVGGDCDDGDPTVNPGVAELCDGRDEDCDGAADVDAEDAPAWYADADADGFGSPGAAVEACEPPGGHVADATDCDDGDATVYPRIWYPDADGDGYGELAGALGACGQPPGYALGSGDCDESRADVSPAETDVCNGIDDDCDGAGDDCALGLVVPAMGAGAQVTVLVTGGSPWEVVKLVARPGNGGAGPCFPALGGLCLDTGPKPTTVGTKTADAAGVAAFTFKVPPGMPAGAAVTLQGLAGRGGAGAVKTPPATVIVGP